MPPLITQTTLPFVTTAAFKAHPTFLDLNSLRSGDNAAADQDAELFNILLMASNWAADEVKMPLHAHTRTDTGRTFADRRGRLKFHADHTPVRSVSQLAWGVSYSQMQTYNNPTVWREGDETIVYEINGASWSWGPGSLQLGSAPVGELYTSMTYVAGYSNSVLVGGPALGAMAVTLSDVTGIQPGDVLRIWEPGVEEAVTVAAGYVPGASPVTLAAATTKNHTAGAGVSQLPAEAHLAVIYYGVATLTHPDRQAEDEFPDSNVSPSTKAGDARQTGAGLVAEAKRLLNLFRDQR